MARGISSATVDYLILGHIAEDLIPQGPTLGGTVAYAGLTARAFGLRVGVVTSAGNELDLSSLAEIEMCVLPARETTRISNIYTPAGRKQVLKSRAEEITLGAVPSAWRGAPIVHLGPIADEVHHDLVMSCASSFLVLTPQGWLRTWDEDGLVSLRNWRVVEGLLPRADAVVLSTEDLRHESAAPTDLSDRCPMLVITDGPGETRVFTDGRESRYRPPPAQLVDPTGAGDIFAAAFAIALKETGDPCFAARLANDLAARSVSRAGLAGVPSVSEVQAARSAVRP
ncbi:MAG TPA: PfkB family carbohydrate kinase [Anaerolineales bacterium]|nr:PfkB family carbohydrate kinase [Anaerolineales bacterium]